LEPNAYGGSVGEYRYQFEGEDDLLHLYIVRQSGDDVAVEEAQAVTEFLLPGIPKALIWFHPGVKSHHFFLGHDLLLEHLTV
jgi:hypothetical protein